MGKREWVRMLNESKSRRRRKVIETKCWIEQAFKTHVLKQSIETNYWNKNIEANYWNKALKQTIETTILKQSLETTSLEHWDTVLKKKHSPTLVCPDTNNTRFTAIDTSTPYLTDQWIAGWNNNDTFLLVNTYSCVVNRGRRVVGGSRGLFTCCNVWCFMFDNFCLIFWWQKQR